LRQLDLRAGRVSSLEELYAKVSERAAGLPPDGLNPEVSLGGEERSGAARDGESQDDTSGSDVVRKDTGRSDAVRKDTGRSDAVRKDTGRSDAVRKDTGRSDAVQEEPVADRWDDEPDVPDSRPRPEKIIPASPFTVIFQSPDLATDDDEIAPSAASERAQSRRRPPVRGQRGQRRPQ
ncbi:DEAD/DEAH box helicase, partial [Streptosporangium sandarakinum]